MRGIGLHRQAGFSRSTGKNMGTAFLVQHGSISDPKYTFVSISTESTSDLSRVSGTLLKSYIDLIPIVN